MHNTFADQSLCSAPWLAQRTTIAQEKDVDIDSTLWLRRLGRAAGGFLGLVLLVAAWAKTPDPNAFAGEIAHHGLNFMLPANVMAILALGIEVALGSALVLGLRRPWILWPTVALVALFIYITGKIYVRHLAGEVLDELATQSCGCFGDLLERTPAQAFWQDVLLLLPSLRLAFVGPEPQEDFPVRRLAVVAVATVATMVVAVLRLG